ncbi:MAG: hypothetical protein ABS76_13210 [Pelagibacterium sp. SCN 64-44]|nr:MAG: hypothetical protein ABS76_13210 [Pelagibacterium sp. SCN 64-44]
MLAAVRAGPLQALALQAGQMLDGRVVGPAPNGGTQVEIRGQMLNLLLPLATKPGQTLRFEVQGSGAQMRLAMQAPSAPAPAASASTASPAQPAPSTPASPAVAPPPTLPGTAGPAPPSSAPTAAAVPSTAPAPVAAAPMPVNAPGVSTYPQPAATALPAAGVTPPPVAALAGATASAPPAPAPVLTTDGTRPVNAAMASGSATSQPLPTPPQAPSAPPPPVSPQAALAQMVQAAVPRQGSVVALTSALTALVGRVALPEPVLRAAQQVLGHQMAVDGPKFDGAALQTALRGSGLFQEASLARGQAPLPQADMKSALLGLRQTLGAWLGQQAPLTPVAQIPPPLRGSVPRARLAEPPPLDIEAGPEAAGRQVLERTESALARLRLHQHASLPEQASRGTEWSVDLPVLAGGQSALLHIQIHRDAPQAEGENPADRGWQLRFAINLSGLGEVGAQVSLRAGATGVMLWAAEPETAQALEAGLDDLRRALAEAGLTPGALVVRHGEPPAPAPAPSGHFVDARR